MKKKIKFGFRLAMLGAVLFAGVNAFGLGSDYFTNNAALAWWPKGMAELVNATNRVHGYFVNETDVFFFQGSAADLNFFLQAYSKIEGIDGHELILHEGVGNATSPWGKNSWACDWSVIGHPKGWAQVPEVSGPGTNPIEAFRAGMKVTNYALTVNFWTGGKIAFDQLKIPENVKVVREAKPQ